MLLILTGPPSKELLNAVENEIEHNDYVLADVHVEHNRRTRYDIHPGLITYVHEDIMVNRAESYYYAEDAIYHDENDDRVWAIPIAHTYKAVDHDARLLIVVPPGLALQLVQWLPNHCKVKYIMTKEEETALTSWADVTESNRTVREEVLQEASKLIVGDRQRDYGPPTENFAGIAKEWSLEVSDKLKPGECIDELDVVRMMIRLKLRRAKVSPWKRDSWVDIGGYAGLGGELGDVLFSKEDDEY